MLLASAYHAVGLPDANRRKNMSTLRYDDKVALITGVSPGGLGFSHAQMLASRGATVVVNDLGVGWDGESTVAGTDESVRLLVEDGGKASGVTGDIFTEADRIVNEVIERHGRLDILINNAGSGGDFDMMIDVHVRGTYRMSEAAWPWLERSGAGRIINTASCATWGTDGWPGYGTAKSALLALTRGQARNGRAAGIAVNSILPIARSNSTEGEPDHGVRAFFNSWFDPDHVAGFVAYLCHETTAITGEAFALGGGAVTRVVQAETQGIVNQDKTPDVWSDLIGDVMNLDNLVLPQSMWDEIGLLAKRIGPDAHAAFEQLDLSQSGGA